MFFGQYPIIVEGDTEFAISEYIIQKYESEYPTNKRPILVRARGEFTILTIIKILIHFKVNFSVLYDADYPFRKDGKVNSAWIANNEIFKAINNARRKGIKAIHRVSMPYFEFEHSNPVLNENNELIDPDSKDKPWNMLNIIKNNDKIEESVKKIFNELNDCNSKENIYGNDILKTLEVSLKEWCKQNDIRDIRIFPSKK